MSVRKNKKIFGFSIAEAMVTLLIVSIAVSAAAPIFTKRNEYRTNTGSSFWVTAEGLNNITRPRGKVGIGVPTNATPEAMLDIRSNADNFITIKRNGRDIFTVNNAGRMVINIPGDTARRALSIQQDGRETALINSNGVIVTNNISDANRTMFAVRNNGVNTTTINSSGVIIANDLSDEPRSMIVVQSRGENTTRIGSNGTLILNNPTARDATHREDDLAASRILVQRRGTSLFRVTNDGTSRASRHITTKVDGDGWVTATAIRDIVGGQEVTKYWEKYNGTTAWNPTYNSVVLFRGACPASNNEALFNDTWTTIGTTNVGGITISYCQRTQNTQADRVWRGVNFANSESE